MENNRKSHLALLACVSFLTACGGAEESASDVAQTETASHANNVADVTGTVHFENSCSPEVGDAFDTAVAMLHSFEFDESRMNFEQIAANDPACAMAHWGIAMTYYHPLWAPPNAAELAAGAESVARARELGSNFTSREQAYIEAIGAFYDAADGSAHRVRAVRYEEAMANVVKSNPNDVEAEIFHGLAQISTADPTDKTYAIQDRVGVELEAMFDDMPDHPGLAHYIIHSYDYPDLAARAVHAADRYLEIASTMPHALHMSGHIYTQLGMWERSIHANSLSADEAVKRAAMHDLGEGTQDELHSIDYLVYAHLQRGENTRALEIVNYVDSFQSLNLNNGVIVFNAAALPVRYTVERRDWEAAAKLPLLSDVEAMNGNDQLRNAVAMRYWARIVGAALTGNLEQAETDLGSLQRVAESLASNERIWGRNTAQVFSLQAEATIALAKGEHARAEQLMRSAVDLEDQTDKSSISPGRVIPAHEQMGDLLMELGRPAEALDEYQESMKHAAARLNNYLGAIRAAEAIEDFALARRYGQELLDFVAEDSDRSEIGDIRSRLNL